MVTKSYIVPAFEINTFEYNNKLVKYLTFDGAISVNDFDFIPALWDKIEVNQLYDSYAFSLLNAKYEPLTSEESVLIPATYNYSEPLVDIKTATDKNRYYAMLSVIPIVKNASGQYQKLVSFEIRFEGKDPIVVSKSRGLRNSVLATGTWYKIAVVNTGLHKVTYNDLKTLGVNLSGLRSANISLYGNGGGMLPDVNPVVQIDDLLSCPIMIKDNGSGVFDENSYFVFYAQGPHTWEVNPATEIFTHKKNIYSDSAYYFINVDPTIGEKKRIEVKSFLNQTANKQATYFMHYDFYEKDKVNLGESGREWFDGEYISASSSKTYSFSLPEMYDNNSGRLAIRVALTNTTTSGMDVSWGSYSKSFTVTGSGSSLAKASFFRENSLPFNSGNMSLSLKFNSPQSSAFAYLDYIELQSKCKLKIVGDKMPFAITEHIGASNITSVTLQNATAQTVVWDVTEHNAVYAVEGKLNGTQFTFHTPTDKPRRFVAFNGTAYNTVNPSVKVPNQNLHNFKNVDMVIVSHPDFLSEANRLAQFRTDNDKLTVKVVTPAQVYNEFSSGAQDMVAIRNFMRYLYDNDGQIKHLLLFGRPSYDYRGLVSGTKLFVPNYQSTTNLDTFVTIGSSFDDFFGVLGIKGGDINKDLVNIGVGRFPVTKLSEAKIAVDKTINSSVRYKISPQNSSQVPNFADWRNVMTFVSDDEDGMNHIGAAEESAKEVASKYPAFNLDKIYCDAYPSVSYAGGKRFPAVNEAILRRLDKGTLAIAYFGHGGGNGWAQERILEMTDIRNLKNKYNQPLMITLTCSFGWYDKQAVSPAENVFLNDNGGACALITTSRETTQNSDYGKKLFSEIGSKLDGKYKTIGEIQRVAKNEGGVSSGATGSAAVVYLMGDPAMKINIPNQNVYTDEILGTDGQKLDTLKALSKITVKGRIADDEGKTLTNFNGNIYPTIFDKPVIQKTLDQEIKVNEFVVQKNIIFKGNASVKGGVFNFSFFVPKDINFEMGKGKISYYATTETDDAGGYFDGFVIGGMSDNPIECTKGPEVRIYLNDDKFVPGSITNQNPVLFIKLKDDFGINTTGNGIGHDLVAILDNNVEKQMILNDYYLADQDSYNSGTVRFPLQDLAPGTHTIKVRAWNICNIPTEESIDFVVKSDEKLTLDRVMNYPNPFTTRTSFLFEHNQPGETFDILVHIYTVSGKLVKTITHPPLFLEGTRCDRDIIVWDGRDEYGDKIGKGVYVYRLTVRNSQGKTAEKIEKIAIL